ncbi:Pycsar system effector family protein [Kitasatospora sp. P5_F3]
MTTTEHDQPVYVLAKRVPWQEMVWHRLSGRRDRALVLTDRAGRLHLAGARRRVKTTEPAPGRRPWPHRYERAHVVHLDERRATRPASLPTAYGAEGVDLQVAWWVHDPVRAVGSGTVQGWWPVRRDIDQRLRQLKEHYATTGHGFGADDVMQFLSAPYLMPNQGLAYRVTEVAAREGAAELRLGSEAGALPQAWGEQLREEYEFCQRAVHDGPAALAALWLARKPDEVRDVLDWAVSHQGLLRGETSWQDSVAGLLGKLTVQEQQELSHLLRDRLVALGRPVPGPRKGDSRRRPGPALPLRRRRPRRRPVGRRTQPMGSNARTVAAMERLMTANSAELTRADTKAAVLLGFTGAGLGAFVELTRRGYTWLTADGWDVRPFWWAAVSTGLLAVVCFVVALAPRHRNGRRYGAAGPGYFEHIRARDGRDRLNRAFEQASRDPAGPLLASLAVTSVIIRTKYRWIEAGIGLLLLTPPQFAVLLWLA